MQVFTFTQLGGPTDYQVKLNLSGTVKTRLHNSLFILTDLCKKMIINSVKYHYEVVFEPHQSGFLFIQSTIHFAYIKNLNVSQ